MPNKNRLYRMLRLCLLVIFLNNIVLRAAAQSDLDVAEIKTQLQSVGVKSTNRADWLLKFGRYCLYKPGELKSDMDSALLLCHQGAQLSEQLHYSNGIGQAILLEGEIYRELQQPDKGMALVNKALKYFQERRMLKQQGDCHTALAAFYNNETDGIETKLLLYQKAAEIYKQTGDKALQANSLKMTGDLLGLQGKFANAIDTLQESLRLYKLANHQQLQGIYDLIANMYTSMGNYDLSLQYALQAVTVAESVNDQSLQMSMICNHIGMTYYSLFQDEKAVAYWQRGIEIAKRFSDTPYIQTLTCNLVNGKLRLGKPQEALQMMQEVQRRYPPQLLDMKVWFPCGFLNIYMDMKKLSEAKPYFEQIEQFHHSVDKSSLLQVYIFRGCIKYLLLTRQFAKMYTYLKEFDAYIDKKGNRLYRSQNHLQWFRADSATGKLASAIEHYKMYKLLSDSVNSDEKNKKIANLQIQFETNQKDKNIELLNRKNLLQLNAIQQQKTTRNIIIATLIFTMLLLLLGYNRYQLKQRVNRQLEQQQAEINQQNKLLKNLLGEKEWLLKEIHHRVKNNLQIVISLLNTQSAYLDNDDALAAIKNSQHRMQAMSLIHQKLYQSDNLSGIDMQWYIKELVQYMQDSFGTAGRIDFQLNTTQLCLDVVQAVPVGLILNEAVTNAIKYAFTQHDQRGLIVIELAKSGDDTCRLQIWDNGKGLPNDFDIHQVSSLGMSLMKGLSDQLGATFTLKNDGGLKILIEFAVKSIIQPSL